MILTILKPSRFLMGLLSLTIALYIGVGGTMTPGMTGKAALADDQSECRRLFPMVDWRTDCFPPADRAVAEHHMTVAPVPPGQTVWRLTSLRLNDVAVLTFPGGKTSINYLYGKVNLANGFPGQGGPGSEYVLVTETVGHLSRSGVYFDRPVAHGLWRLLTNVPHRGLYLTVESTIGRGVEREVASRLLARARSA